MLAEGLGAFIGILLSATDLSETEQKLSGPEDILIFSALMQTGDPSSWQTDRRSNPENG